MANEIDDIITDVIKREGGSTETNDPLDAGGRTAYGISEKSNPEAWADGKVTSDEARAIYLAKYVKNPGFDTIPDARLMHQMVDFGVLSGPSVAIRKLQHTLRVAEDGILGPTTLKALSEANPRAINNALCIERCKMLAQIVQKTPSQARFLVDWLDRALSFLL